MSIRSVFQVTAIDLESLRWSKIRVTLLACLVLAGASAVTIRAYDLQVEKSDGLRAMVEEQSVRTVALAPKRGTVYDRRGAVLAVSVEADSVFANPRLMRKEGVDISQVATSLGGILGKEPRQIYRRLRKDKLFVWLKRHVTPTQAKAVAALKIPGLHVQQEPKRYYPNGGLASHLLGFANVDGEGIAGIELSQNEDLKGLQRTVRAVRDSRGRVVFADTFFEEHSVRGANLELTLDRMVQHIAERELALAVKTFEAKAGSVVVMDPATGDVLAMASYPTFDPNRPSDFKVGHRRNRAVTDHYEPGSTVKAFTIAGALARGSISPNARIDCEEGAMAIGEDVIHDTAKHAMMTPAKILAKSSNIGAAKIGDSMGKKGLFRTLRAFGFGRKFALSLPGETKGILRHYSDWYELDAATIAFGQGMSVSTLQLAAATAALANGGKLMKPRIVGKVLDANGNVNRELHPTVLRRPVPPRVANLVSEMMIGVTGDEGTGSEAALEGYLVAGKTGTAEKADHRRGGYSRDRWVASFTGFVPATAPRLVITVSIDEPVIAHGGGTVAGPVFRRIAERSLRYMGVAPRQFTPQAKRTKKDEEKKLAAAQAQQNDEPAVARKRRQAAPPIGHVRVPDFAGLHARATMRDVAKAKLNVEVSGSGIVTWQMPAAGAVVPEGTVVAVRLDRPWMHRKAIDNSGTTVAAADGFSATQNAGR